MSVYTYHCEKCDDYMDLSFRMDEERPLTVPCSCGGIRKRVLTPPNIHYFKPYYLHEFENPYPKPYRIESKLHEERFLEKHNLSKKWDTPKD